MSANRKRAAKRKSASRAASAAGAARPKRATAQRTKAHARAKVAPAPPRASATSKPAPVRASGGPAKGAKAKATRRPIRRVAAATSPWEKAARARAALRAGRTAAAAKAARTRAGRKAGRTAAAKRLAARRAAERAAAPRPAPRAAAPRRPAAAPPRRPAPPKLRVVRRPAPPSPAFPQARDGSAKQRVLFELVRARTALMAALHGLGGGTEERPLGPGRWSIREAVLHLVTRDRARLQEFESTLHGRRASWIDLPQVTTTRMNEEALAPLRHHGWDDALRMLQLTRQQLMEAIEAIPAEPAERWTQEHPFGEMLLMLPPHDRRHAEQIKAARMAAAPR